MAIAVPVQLDQSGLLPSHAVVPPRNTKVASVATDYRRIGASPIVDDAAHRLQRDRCIRCYMMRRDCLMASRHILHVPFGLLQAGFTLCPGHPLIGKIGHDVKGLVKWRNAISFGQRWSAISLVCRHFPVRPTIDGKAHNPLLPLLKSICGIHWRKIRPSTGLMRIVIMRD